MTKLGLALLTLAPALAVCTLTAAPQDEAEAKAQDAEEEEEKVVEVQFLEIVTPEVQATCDTLAKLHGVEFSKPVMEFGMARTASLEGGGLISVRGPLRADEGPVVRPYTLVEDIDAAVAAAKEAGAVIAHPPMQIPKRGKFAIYILGGIEHGLWQN